MNFSQYLPFPALHNIWLFSVKGHMTGQWLVDPLVATAELPEVPFCLCSQNKTEVTVHIICKYSASNRPTCQNLRLPRFLQMFLLPVRTIEQGGGIFSCSSRSRSIGTDSTVPVVGLCVNAHQGLYMKIPFVQTREEGIKERSVSH